MGVSPAGFVDAGDVEGGVGEDAGALVGGGVTVCEVAVTAGETTTGWLATTTGVEEGAAPSADAARGAWVDGEAVGAGGIEITEEGAASVAAEAVALVFAEGGRALAPLVVAPPVPSPWSARAPSLVIPPRIPMAAIPPTIATTTHLVLGLTARGMAPELTGSSSKARS
jgi:hypothetical protein